MKDKVVLVTGATNGIGKKAALEIAKEGCTVVVVGRNAEKTAATVEEIKKACKHERVDSLLADLSEIGAVRKAAKAFRERYDRLDVLLNNAGAFYAERHLTADGYEMTLALNHLSYFVMSMELLDLLKQTATRHGEARIVNVASDAHRIAKKGVNFDDIHLAKRYSGWGRYGESKLMNILFTKALAQRLEGTGVICNAVHPGFVATSFAHNNRSLLTPLLKLSQKLFARTEEKGAETLIYLSISPEVKGSTGGYFFNNKPRKAIPIAQSEEQRERLWTLSEELVAGK